MFLVHPFLLWFPSREVCARNCLKNQSMLVFDTAPPIEVFIACIFLGVQAQFTEATSSCCIKGISQRMLLSPPERTEVP
jgi:hypothetical protein